MVIRYVCCRIALKETVISENILDKIKIYIVFGVARLLLYDQTRTSFYCADYIVVGVGPAIMATLYSGHLHITAILGQSLGWSLLTGSLYLNKFNL